MNRLANVILSLLAAILPGCRNGSQIEAEKLGPPVMDLHFVLTKNSDLIFEDSFQTFRKHKEEQELGYSISHQVVPDKAEIYDEVCQVIIRIESDDYRIAAHIPIHESETEESIEVDSYRLVFVCTLPDR
ncbi:hypothetical protein [Roseibacillus persicicus]|uniref:Uncharacterized protein n=1 Tax=Roseibacillus persicicus TaxID=454148 RepID=A0A918TXX0_9BACT|nr:hypothetical protein [Roseibacillus persicicus]GHC68005.1 hypothetical protein GCM10007100_40130 [Roseibacillus persicicus]